MYLIPNSFVVRKPFKKFIDWRAHGNFHGNFLELGPQKGINKSKTSITFNMFNTNTSYNFVR
jgi:hypothetical protein